MTQPENPTQLSLLDTAAQQEPASPKKDGPLTLTPLALSRLNPQQQKAASAPMNTGVQVLAGAGTGKTELIAHRYVTLYHHLLAQGLEQPENHLLVVTFTELAATGMANRIQRYLADSGITGLSGDHWIATFHGFCRRVLQRHAPRVGLTVDFNIVGFVERRKRFQSLLERVAAGEMTSVESTINDLGLATHIPATILDLEHMKTLDSQGLWDLLDAMPSLVDQIKSAGLSPQEFRAVARAQAAHLTDTLQHLPDRRDDGNDFEDWTDILYHWAQRLKPWADPSWLEPMNDCDWDKKAANALLKKLLPAEAFVDTSNRKAKPPQRDEMAIARQAAVQDTEYRLIDMVTVLYALYQENLRQDDQCDYDDLILYTLELFKTVPELKHHYQSQFKALMVDEFQDSNGSQLALIQALMNPDTPNLLVVGDDKQSIYRFRHAQRENLHLIFKGLSPTVVPLQTNYRSLEPILNTANHLAHTITGGDEHHQLNAGKTSDPTHPTSAPPVTWMTWGQRPNPEDKRPQEEAIDSVEERAARWLAQEIDRLNREEGVPLGDIAILVKKHAKGDRVEWACAELGIPVLRSHSAQFVQHPAVKDALAALTMVSHPHQDGPWVRFLSRKLTQRQLALLHRFQSQWEKHRRDTSERRPFQTTKPSLYLAIDVLCHSPHTLPLEELPPDSLRTQAVAELGDTVMTALTHMLADLNHLREYRFRHSAAQVFRRIGDTWGLIPPELDPVPQVQWRSALQTLELLLNRLDTPDDHLPLSLADVLERLELALADPDLELPAPDWGNARDAIQIKTMHSAKGLEFPVVFVFWVEAPIRARADGPVAFAPQFEGKPGFGLFLRKMDGADSWKQSVFKTVWNTPQDVAELKRLFYVALTRAEEKLYVLRSRQSDGWTDASQALMDSGTIQYWEEDGDSSSEEDTFPTVSPLPFHAQKPEPPKTPLAPSHHHPGLSVLAQVKQHTALLQRATIPTRPQNLEAPALSFTAIEQHQRCPVSYWYRYVWHLPTPMAPAQAKPESIARGIAIHQLIETHFRHQGTLPEALQTAILDHHQPEGTATEPWRHTLLQRFQDFLDSPWSWSGWHQRGITLLEPECPLQFSLPVSVDSHTQEVTLHGVVDLLALDQTQNQKGDTPSRWLIDFKTNERLSPEALRQYMVQLALYRQGLLQETSDIPIPQSQVVLVHLGPKGCQAHTLADHPVSTVELEKAIAPVLRTHRQMSRTISQADSPTTPTMTTPTKPEEVSCTKLHCPYLLACPQGIS